FPTGFDKDGQMFSNTRFGDLPHRLPTKKWENKDELFTGWMLLSYKKPVTASSVLDTFKTIHVTDENPRTFWVASQNKSGEWITIDLQKELDVKALQVNYTDYKSDIFDNDPARVYTQFKIFHSRDGKVWEKIVDLTDQKKRDRPNAYIELDKPVRTRYIKYEHVYVASPKLAISDIRIFGNGSGPVPKTPSNFSARRDVDTRNAFVGWQKVPGAVGYNILWGISGDKLYQTYQLFADQPDTFEIRALSKGVEYFFAIEAFNENGISKVSEIIHVK
ncbi:MAG: coagulation factor 5/8 type domain protein, partial [Marivirga sp.]|nr:coagulation factor 5/8 type domain protein [Marivirga sp.]